MPTSPIDVIIIGAGTGGLCLAQGLKRAGISVGVYERDRTRADGLQGYRVGIDADGKRALRANLPPEQNYLEGQWRTRERERLIRAIARAAGEDTGNEGKSR